jgi:hypothetical protein
MQRATAEEAISAGGLDWREKLVPIQTDEVYRGASAGISF